MIGYYKRFVKDFCKISTPLMKLMQKKVPFVWIHECENVFQPLKPCLTMAPVLALPFELGGYMVYYNASTISLICVDAKWKNDSIFFKASEETWPRLSKTWFGDGNSGLYLKILETLSFLEKLVKFTQIIKVWNISLNKNILTWDKRNRWSL